MISGLVITLWVGIGAQLYPPLPEKTLRLPLSVDGCIVPEMNQTTTMTPFTTVLQTTTPMLVISYFSLLQLICMKLTSNLSNLTFLMMSFRPRPPLADSWYSLSYLYFCPVGILVTMITGLLVSAVSGKDNWF